MTASAFGKSLAQARRLHAAGKLREAEALFSGILKSHGTDAAAVTELAKTAAGMGEADAALSLFRRAASLAPHDPATPYNLGKFLKSAGQTGQAVNAYRQALLLDPTMAGAHYNLGNALSDLGHLDEAVKSYRQAADLEPDNDQYASNLLLALNYLDSMPPEDIFAQHAQWGKAREAPFKDRNFSFPNPPDPERRLTVGYVSPDFRSHSVSYFFEPVAASHDHRRFKVVMYDDQIEGDAVTKRLKGMADLWRSVHGHKDEALEKQIRTDRVDILVDLAGHSRDNRLSLFARRPAPVQVSWIGYPNTSGLRAIDWRLTDDIADPVGTTDHLHTEKLCRLPRGFLCFRPPDEMPEIPATRSAGQITFGSLNNFSKVSGTVIALWAAILKALPDSRMIVKNFAFASEETRDALANRFSELGIEPGRIEMLSPVKGRAQHLAAYHRIDVALDTYPYSGTATTCEALWMGVPVITLTGTTHASRVSASLLTRLDLGELIAASPEDYVAKAVALANDPKRLARLRNGLRERMKNSPLLDAEPFTRSVEDAYRSMWAEWCRSR